MEILKGGNTRMGNVIGEMEKGKKAARKLRAAEDILKG